MKLSQAKHIVTVLMKQSGTPNLEIIAYMEGVDPKSIRDSLQAKVHNDHLRDTYRKGKDYITQAKALYNPLDESKIGDGLTFGYGSDREAYTIVSRTDKTITAVRDKATLLNGDELEFIPGGFSAHCTNQHIQKYKYEADPDGVKMVFRRRKNGKWLPKGSSTQSSGARPERHKFHDYNF